MFENGFGGFKFGFGGGDDDYPEQKPKKNVDNQGLYDLLGVDKKATTEEIKKAFKKKAIKEHPDKGGDPQKFKEVTMAKDILCDPDKRDLYDRHGLDGIKEGGGGGGGNPFDVFGNLFGFGGRGAGGDAREKQKKGKPQLKEQKVTLEDVYLGKLIKLQHQRKQICQECDGKGGSSVTNCTKCKGKGLIEKMVMLGPGMYQHMQQHCTDCKGEGKTCAEKDKCKTCKGNKVVDQKKVIDVAIEQGVPNEHDYVYSGECDELPGQLGGDLHVRIIIQPHKKFERKGADLFFNKDITLLEALTGFNFELEHLDKTKILITTFAQDIIQHGDVKTIKNKGMPFYKDSMSHGNLYIKFNVLFPKKGELKPQQIETLKTVLPGPKQKELPKSGNIEYLEEFHEDEQNPNAEGGQNRKKGYYDEDDQHGHGAGAGGQQRVQCQQQ